MGFHGLLGLCGVFLSAAVAGEPEPELPALSTGEWTHVDGGAARIIRAPGRVVLNPTGSLTVDAFPFDGVEIGRTNACLLHVLGEPYRIEFEGLGEVGDLLEANHRYVFTCFVRGWSDAIETLMPDNFGGRGERTQHAIFEVPGSRKPGSSELDNAVSLLFVPDDPIHVPAVLLYRAIPDWSSGAEIVWQRGKELGLPLAFECVEDGTRRILQIGRLGDLEL